jgi:apolipoprotein N-acyltransferase
MDPLLTITKMAGSLPDSDWVRFGTLLLVLLAALQTVRLVSRVNRSLLLFLFVIGTIGLLSSWVRHRNEPIFLTPVVEAVAPYFPAQLRSPGI